MAHVVSKWLKKRFIDSLAADNLYLMLLSNAHVPDAINHHYISDVSANEITDSGGKYVAGGFKLQTPTSQVHGANYYLDAINQAIGPGANLNYRWGVLYTNTGVPTQSVIWQHIDFLADQIVTNGTSTIEWNAFGLTYLQ